MSTLCILIIVHFLVTIDLCMAEPQSARKKRKCLKMGDKQKVIGNIKAGKHVEDIACEYGRQTEPFNARIQL